MSHVPQHPAGPWRPPPGPRQRFPRVPNPAVNPAATALVAVEPPHATSSRDGLGAVPLVLAAVAAVAALYMVGVAVGPQAALLGGVLALVPLAFVLLAIRWLDRWEPEPRGTMWFAFLWGAGVSVIVAMVGNQLGAEYLEAQTGDAGLTIFLTASYVAPIVEETAKGVGVLLIFVAGRRYFDGPVDGVVYAATVGAGFAFSENILYFGRAADGLATVFIARAIFSPFAHVLFTACVGIALGVASRRRANAAALVAFPLGLLAAIALHAFWNASTALGEGFLVLYVVVQVPLFLMAIALAFWLGRQEARIVRARLDEYARAGWFLPHEVGMLASQRERRRARSWARGFGRAALAAMRSFQRTATELAYHRQRTLTHRTGLRPRSDEAALLAALTRDRSAFAAARSRSVVRR